MLVQRLFLCLRSAPQASPSFVSLSLSLSPSFDLPLSSPALWPDPGLTCAAEDGSVSGVVLPRALLVFLIGPNDAPEIPACLAQDTPIFCEESAV